jgi:hypothetical protein
MQSSLWSIVPIFRGPFLEKVARGTHLPAILELADCHSRFGPPSPRSSLSSWFDFFYGLLFEQYRCEYIYKNAITTKLFLSRHSLKNSFMTDEIRSGKSRADVAILNGTSTVYEIKSQYDSLERLGCQLMDYKRVFDRICVVTTHTKALSAVGSVESSVGIIVMRDDGTLSTLREPTSNKDYTDPGAIFDCMRRSESNRALVEAFGFVPQVPNSQLYRKTREMFRALPPAMAHDLMVDQVKKRGKKKPFADLIGKAPASLKHACMSFSKSASMATDIARRLEQPLT